ncbi:P-loop containing nucleoside triphosphate hydrolase protein [Xylariaceae sp. FL0255]|nr:P-loop containing nucleoside triphosphate hydrolase protein [Xylariaceae sp. FL0255]
MARLGLEDAANIFSRLSFSWNDAILWKAFLKGSVAAEDLRPVRHTQRSALVVSKYLATRLPVPLLWQLFDYARLQILWQGFWAFLTSIFVFAPPLLIKYILEFLDDPAETATLRNVWLSALGLLLSGLITGVAESQCAWEGSNLTARVRCILLGLVYRKVLHRPVAKPLGSTQPSDEAGVDTDSQAADGRIINLVSADVDFTSSQSGNLYLVWVTFPVQTVIGTCLLYNILGTSGMFGVLLMTTLLLLNVVLSKRLAAVQTELLSATDARVQGSNELLPDFRRRLMLKRGKELKVLWTRFIWWSINLTVFYSLPFLATLFTLALYTAVWGNTLQTTTAFPALTTLSILRIPLNRLADSITYLIQAYVSLCRLDQFLSERETDKYLQLNGYSRIIGFEGADLSWPNCRGITTASTQPGIPLDDSHPNGFKLRQLDISFKRGGLNVIIGPSGSGKSSLLLALLGEMRLKRGQVYSPQHIKSNILLGLPFHGQRYKEALDAVALGPDLASFAERDETLAGERGSRLSGSQKQRVALARALYHTSDAVVLDDCLSAVDSHIANHIFTHAIKGPLMRGRTCILATHHVQLAVPQSDLVVLLGAGEVQFQGPPQRFFSDCICGKGPSSPIVNSVSGSATSGAKDIEDKKLKGAVPWKTIMFYLQSLGGVLFWSSVLLGFIKQWAHEGHLSGNAPKDVGSKAAGPWYYLGVYLAVVLVFAALTFARDMVALTGSVRASTTVYEQFLDSVLGAKLTFFDRPMGQITNRFVKDIGVIDQYLASFSISALQIVVSVAIVAGLILQVIPIVAVLLILPLVFFAYVLVMMLYTVGARDLKRIEAASRSPLYQRVEETINGCSSIRSYNKEAFFVSKIDDLVDGLNRPYLLLSASKHIITCATGAFVVANKGSIESGIAGLALTYAATFTESMLWLSQIYAIVQENLTSLEPIVEYSSIDREGAVAKTRREGPAGAHTIPYEWPQSGHVVFRNFTARYGAELDPVLRDVNFEAKAAERVAVVGRTGAGKSSLVLSLLRALDPDTGGSIEIDGVDISSVTLSRLRGEAVTVIPQDVQLFDGTVRDNIDALHQHSDDEIRAVLQTMQYGLKLDAAASELSRGQRQIVCMARGLLRRTRVLVLDGATASVDHEADKAIQSGVRAYIADYGATVITIAHRLLSIADYDRVVVMDSGRVVEQGRIKDLLQMKAGQSCGLFRRLCEESGDLDAIQRLAG